MWKFWQILLGLALGVAANLVTPYVKRILRRGKIELSETKIAVLEEDIEDAYYFSKHPTRLPLYLLKEFIYI